MDRLFSEPLARRAGEPYLDKTESDMALELGALRNALLVAGASPEKAGKAAEELAAYQIRFDGCETRLAGFEARVASRFAKVEGDLTLIRWIIGFNLAFTLTILWRVFAH